MNRLISTLLIACGTLLAAPPDYVPPFAAVKGGRGAPELVVGSSMQKGKSYDLPSLRLGNKSVNVRETFDRIMVDREEYIGIYIDGREILRFSFWGSLPEKNSGYPFRTVENGKRLTCDRERNEIRFEKDYLLPDGTKCTFHYLLKSLGDSLVELSWDAGLPDDKSAFAKQMSLVPWINSSRYIDARLRFNGTDFPPESKQNLLAAGKKISRRIPGVTTMEYDGGGPLQSVRLEFPESDFLVHQTGRATPAGKEKFDLWIQTAPKDGKKSGKIRIDLGEAAVAGNTPPPNGGIDFWKHDAMHVPRSPVRNIMPNPSFEQGLRYWTWQNGGADNRGAAQIPRYSIDGTVSRSGKNSLLISPVQSRAAAMQSFALPLAKNRTYTLSFYAKSETPGTHLIFGFFSVTNGGKFPRNFAGETRFSLSTEWNRFSTTVTADGAGVALVLNASGAKVWVDDIQLEESKSPSAFVMPPVEGCLVTSNPDNLIELGIPLDAAFRLSGKPGAKAKLTLNLFNFYREKLYSAEFEVEAGRTVSLPFRRFETIRGAYILRADFQVPGFQPYTDYFRFGVMDSLNNTHPSKNLFATLTVDFARVSRGEEVGRLYQRSGFGSTTYANSSNVFPEEYRIAEKYGIENFLMLPGSALNWKTEEERRLREFWKGIRKRERITDADAKEIEENAYRTAREQTQRKYWALSTESEGSPILRAGRFGEWFKAQSAFARGVRRAIPDAKLYPCGGTSGWSLLRGFREMNGYLAEANRHRFKWDVIAVHPYWDLDGTKGFYDLDTETARLIDVLEKYGYGKTPIYYTEGFNIPNVHVPEWNAQLWNDPYCGNRPTYDTGLREFVQASLAARTFLICMKYWPRVRQFNIWEARLYFDLYLTPKALCFAVNTLGRLFPDPVHSADIRPANGVRGYVFANRNDKTPVAALWCTIDKVEDGFDRGPVLRIRFDGAAPELIDLMGNKREWSAEKDGAYLLPLTPAPLFLKGGDAKKLAHALTSCEVIGSDSNISVAFRPSLDGTLNAGIRNLTGREQKGTLKVHSAETPFVLAPASEKTIALPEKKKPESGKMFRWDNDFSVTLSNGSVSDKHWDMDYFYVPYVKGSPDWTRIPAIPISNFYRGEKAKEEKIAPKLNAKFRTAWNENGFYLRVEAEDPDFFVDRKRFNQPNLADTLYILDGALEVYFDCGANGRSNIRRGYDQDDYRYDFSFGNIEGKTGRGFVNRLREVNWQFAGGLSMPTKDDVRKNLECRFIRTGKGYAYEIVFKPEYIEPIRLERGFVSGFGLFLHNQTPDGRYSAVSTATRAGAHCDYNPHLWPLMIFASPVPVRNSAIPEM